MADLVGETIGAYRIVERLGRGGMADVYKAFHTELEVYRAIKFIRPEFVTSDDFRARFRKEAQGVAKLRHPNIVQIHDFGEDRGRYYMVMEFIDGRTLKDILRATTAGLPIDESLALIRQVAGALSYAHGQDLVHRDIKPDNVMIDGSGRPVLMDFGIAKLLTNDTQLTQTGMGIGTPAYMAPEQAKALEVGPPADIYALSIVLFEMLTGRVPFSADTPMAVMLKALSDPMPMPRQFNADISEDLQAVILKGTAKEPEQRYQSVDAFLQALDAVDGAHGAAPLPPSAAAPTEASAASPARPARKRLAPLALIGGLLLALGAGYVIFAPGGSEPPAGTPADAASSDAQPAVPQTQSGGGEGGSDAQASASPSPQTGGADAVIASVNRNIDADEVIRQSVQLNAGDVLFLDVHDTAHATDFELWAPGGRKAVIDASSDRGPVRVDVAGEYAFTVAMRSSRSGRVDVELLRLPEPEIDLGVVQPGEYVAATTALPGQEVRAAVELAADATVFLDVVQSGMVTDFSLIAPDGRTVVLKGYTDQGPVLARQPGTYALRADPRGDDVGGFEINLHVLDPPAIDDGPYTPGTLLTGATRQPGQLVVRQLDLPADAVIYFDMFKSSSVVDFELVAPDGRSRVMRAYSDQGPLQVERGGLHTLRIDPRGDKTASYEAMLHVLAPPILAGASVAAGAMIVGRTEQPGQLVHHPLELSPGSWQFELVESSGVTDFRVVEVASGEAVMNTYGRKASLQLGDGPYRLEADPRGDDLGRYRLRFVSGG